LSDAGKVERVEIRCSPKEKLMAEKLASYLHAAGKIDQPTVSGAFRMGLYYLFHDVLQEIERDRYG